MYKKSIRTSDFLIEKVRRTSSDEPQQLHFHPYYEIGYLTHGTRQMTINKRIYSMEKGKNACDLLIDTDMNITTIALSCGFNDSNYFGDAFKKNKGISPNKYRKNKGII